MSIKPTLQIIYPTLKGDRKQFFVPVFSILYKVYLKIKQKMVFPFEKSLIYTRIHLLKYIVWSQRMINYLYCVIIKCA